MLRGWSNEKTGQVRSPYPGFDKTGYTPYAFQGIHVLSPSLLPLLDEIGRLDFLYSCAGVYDFADKVQLVGGDSAYTVPSRLKTRLVVVDGTKLALETKKSKGFMLIVK